MKIYKVTYEDNGASAGFYFAPSLKAAKANTHVGHVDITECEREIELIAVAATKKGIIAALNRHASHNDNG